MSKNSEALGIAEKKANDLQDRDRQIEGLYNLGYRDEEVKAWAKAHDASRASATIDRFAAGWRALKLARNEFNAPGRVGVPNPVAPPPAGVHAAD